ncbi:MAG: nitroreductase family protein [bacterium]
MKKKLLIISMGVLLLMAAVIEGQTPGNEVINVILSSYSARAFSEEPVTDSQIEQILQCGIKAPSGRNNQPWKFTVVKDLTKVKDLFRSLNSGNVVIIISGMESEQGRMNSAFDCALATENMFIVAVSMGLGARIYTGPVRRINAEISKNLEIPDGYQVVALLRVGNLDPEVDAVSSASPRKGMEEIVNYVEEQ